MGVNLFQYKTTLYLDFINLFLYLLRIFGKRGNNADCQVLLL